MASRRTIFNITAVLNAYAPEVMYMNADNDVRSLMDTVREFTQNIETLPAAAVIEVDILRADGDPTNNAHWISAVFSNNAVGFKALQQVAAAKGVRIRAKSGGNAGAAPVSAWWRTTSAG